MIAPLAWYFAWHWKDYADQALSDVLLLGYVGIGALAICAASRTAGDRASTARREDFAWLRYVHLISTLLTLAASVPHILIAWWRRRKTESSRGAAGWLGVGSGRDACRNLFRRCPHSWDTRERSTATNSLPTTAMPLARTVPLRRVWRILPRTAPMTPQSLAGSETCGASGCHTEIYNEWKTSAHRYAAMDPIFQGIQSVMAKQNGPESTRYCGGCHDPISLFSGTKNIFVEKLTGAAGLQRRHFLRRLPFHSENRHPGQRELHDVRSRLSISGNGARITPSARWRAIF